MAFLFRKFQEAVQVLAKSPTFAKEPRRLQFEADINRLFLYTSYNRLGKDAAEADAEEIIELANNASIDDQQNQVHENIHLQIQNFVTDMDHILVRDLPTSNELGESDLNNTSPSRRSGLSLAVGQITPLTGHPVIPATHPLTRAEVSHKLKDLMGYTLELKSSTIPHKDAGLGLFINGEADVGSMIAFYPGVVYSPAHYRYIPGYPRFDTQNTYMITRYDGTVINAQPWGSGGETRELWNGVYVPEAKTEGIEKGSDKIWKMLSKPLDSKEFGIKGEILEKRNPLALGHYANHPGKDMNPNVMVCSYDFPLTEKSMRTYIPNISFGNGQEADMRRFGSFWFKSWKSSGNIVPENPVLKSLVLVATRAVQDEEILVNYRLSNSKRRPAWYVPVDEEEDRRRWG